MKWEREREEFKQHAIAFDLAYYMEEIKEIRIKGVGDMERAKKAR